MAVTKTYSNVTIRGITYSKGSSFKCYAAVKGNGGSEGNASSATAPTVGTTYYFYCKASGDNVSYPYAITSTSGGSVKGWYTEAIFPYATYSVNFNANGGSGAPAKQTKTYGTNLTLSSTRPTRPGHNFLGWGTSSDDTSVNYNPGDSYTTNAAITLYAIWQKQTYPISFNKNTTASVSNMPSSVNKTYGTNLTLPTTIPTRTNYEFLGWSESSSATTATYAAGGTFTKNQPVTLYAVWKLKYTLPTITNLKAVRCGSDGTAEDFGTYAKVTFNWSCCQLTGTNNVSSITVNGTAVTASGTSGSVSTVIGGSLSIETTHTITVKVIDTLKSSGSGTTTKTTTLAAAVFAIYFKSGGKGVAIGKPATKDNTFDVAFDAKFDKSITQYGYSVPTYKFENGYWGLANFDGSDADYVRTPQYGIIPYASGGSGKCGTSGWPFQDGYFNNLYVSGRPIAVKTLWTGSHYMTADHTITFSDNVQNQAHGIVLAFSQYSGGASNAHLTHFFIPRNLIADFHSCGHVFSMRRHGVLNPCTKYLYISNTQITGHADNSSTATANSTAGIKWANNEFCLRKVYGV